MQQRMYGFRRLALLVVVATAGVLVVGAQAASAQVIEICKSSANGMSGRPFSYTVAPSGGSAFSVGPIAGGRCSGPITVAGATATITEALSDPATDVRSISVRPSNRKLSENLAGRSVTVTTGASTASETLVTFVNQPAGGNFASLKVCKLTETPAYLGRQFSFSVSGGPLLSTEANDAFADPASYICRILGTFQVGSIVTVHEQIPAGSEIQWIDTDPGDRLLDFNTATGDSTILIGAGVTTVYYDNEPAPPAGTGYIEVCKNYLESDPDVSGPFSFTVTDAAGATHELTVFAGQCSEPIQVAAGVNEIAEHATANTQLTDVAAFPWDRLLTVNLINRTATVEVPVSASPNDETQVHFRNEALRGQLKVCKALGPGSADLIGQTFHFTVYDNSDPEHPAFLDDVAITAAASTQCVIYRFLPIGTPVLVVETFGPDNADTWKYDESGQYIDQSGPVSLTIAPGVNTATITNTAKGLLEVCKAPVRFGGIVVDDHQPIPAPPKQPTFTFKVDGGAPFGVQAGKCSLPRRVSVGNHTVTESAATNYELDPDAPGSGIAVFPADREVSKNLANRTVTVSVPYGPYGETLVTFYNRVKRGRIKICKVIPPTSQDALGGKPFTYTVNGRGPVGPIFPGECTFYTGDLPILNALGEPQVITVHEVGTPSDTWDVTGITCTGCKSDPGRPPKTMLAEGTIEFDLGPGINVVTYTNKAKPPVGG